MLAVVGIFATIISGIGWLIKHFIQKRDERQQKVFEERNKERTKIEDRVTKLERKNRAAGQAHPQHHCHRNEMHQP